MNADRGRPAIGREVKVRLDDNTLAKVDRIAKNLNRPRAEVLRDLIAASLDRLIVGDKLG